MPRKAAPKKAPVKKTTAKAKKDIDPFEIPRFLNRWIGKEEVISLIRNEDGDLIKVTKKGDHYFAETDKKVPATRKKAAKKT